jgi:hypothetical protein
VRAKRASTLDAVMTDISHTDRPTGSLAFETLLSRKEAAAALSDLGYPTSYGTLSQAAHNGSGPPYEVYMRRTLYRYGELIAWARQRSKRREPGQPEVYRRNPATGLAR